MSRDKDHDSGSGGRVSRRDFIKGASLTVAGVGITGAAAVPLVGTDNDVPIVGPAPVQYRFTLNGESREVSAEPWTTLLDLVRDRFSLTGSKRVCDRGSCGGCTMLVDGKPVNSCSLLAIDAAGKAVTTIEGISKKGPTPLQRAFMDCDALQCGFCTPGIVMACTAFLEQNPSPTRSEIAEGIAGNICRCGTYENIFEAVYRVTRKGGRRARI